MCPGGNTNTLYQGPTVQKYKYNITEIQEIEQQEGALYQGPTVHNVSRWKYIFTEIQCVQMEIQIQYYRNTMYPDGNTNSMYPDGNTNTLLHKYNVSGWKYKYKITEIQYIPLEIQMQCILI